MVSLPAPEYRVSHKDGAHFLTLKVPDDYWPALDFELASIKGSQVSAKIAKPFKPRTTGERSQNSHAWGHCTEIARALGVELYEVEYIAKVRAIKRGYPVSTRLGIPIPKSQADISTEECAALIEEYHMIAAENGITLTENETEIKAQPAGTYTPWHRLTDAEKKAQDPKRFDEEKQLEIF